ncbi:hypothetical protein [Streptomyces sp. AMCC400023]|uniref:hypothetical protein n=1 Tax=Streptomyces sp. AMCC400023 TaxID=2056258 RepID=UPI001F26F588|nr:hypothetical protein [Streptomyces sp. AMCC400023]UJV42943.1 hypothetical protein CVT30_26650 [Streptomyces sp. AMCC400023]
MKAIRFTAAYAALTAAHEVADYWAQQDSDAVAKGRPGREGAAACARHVAGYTAVQAAALLGVSAYLGVRYDWRRAAAGLAVSALTHYAADRCAGRWNDPGLTAPAVVRLAHRTGHGPWLSKDPGAGPLMDQAWHKGWVMVAAAVAAGGRVPS